MKKEEKAEWTASRVLLLLIVWTFGTIGMLVAFYGFYLMLVLGDEDGFRLAITGVVVSNAAALVAYLGSWVINKKNY